MQMQGNIEINQTDKQPVIEDDGLSWYAMRIFCARQMEIKEKLESRGLVCFIPMEDIPFRDKDNRLKHRLRPVVKNLIFIKKSISESDMHALISDLRYPVSIISKAENSRVYFEIPSKQMYEFRRMCEPAAVMRLYMSSEQAKLKQGTEVVVTNGPLKGFTGKLVRQNKLYYLLKDVPGVAVALKVSRWCCKPVKEQ
jgi:transcription antitermination factor NusG